MSGSTPLRELLLRGLASLGLTLEEGSVQSLLRFAALLEGPGREVGVLGPLQGPDLVREMLVDPLAVAAQVANAARVVDVGTGGGVPGIPLALVREDLRVTLLEATRKKCGFLSRAVGELGLDERVEVVWGRAEEVGRSGDRRESFDVALAKALAPLPTLLELTLPLVRVGGRVVAFKGPRLEEELREAGRALAQLGGEVSGVVPYSLDDRAYRLCVVEKVRPTPRGYPRRPGVPGKQPL